MTSRLPGDGRVEAAAGSCCVKVSASGRVSS